MLVAQTPQMTVGSALDLLRVSKQTGSRLVRDLVQAGYLVQRTGTQDRRQRQLTLTEEGRRLDRLLWERQRPRLFGAFRACGLEAVEGFRKVLLSICDPPERRVLERPSAAPF
jgi:DNA-binding MarR family transcriptional regulator